MGRGRKLMTRNVVGGGGPEPNQTGSRALGGVVGTLIPLLPWRSNLITRCFTDLYVVDIRVC